MVQIVTFTGTLADTSEDRVTTVRLRDVVDELLDEDCLADTSTTEKTNLSTTRVGSEKVDDLDTGNENLGRCRLLDEFGSVGVNRGILVRFDRSALVDGVTSDVHDATESACTDRNCDGSTSVLGLCATDETFGTCMELAVIPQE